MGSLLVLFVLASGCGGGEETAEPQPKPVRAADVPCETDATDTFYAENATYTDPDVIDLPEAKPSANELTEFERASKDLALSRSVQSFVVMRRGEIVFERYFNGAKVDNAENIHSAGKSILSILTGQAIADGKLSMSTKIADVLPAELVPDGARAITVKDLLTMSAGLQWEENVTEPEIEQDESYVRAILDRPRDAEPGKEFHYSTGLSQVLSAVIAEATGMSTCAYANTKLFRPLGITVDHWHVDPDGYNAGGHSMFLTPRELAVIGQLVADAGRVDGEQIVPAAWLKSTTTETWDRGCRAPGERRGYGAGWWRSEIGGTTLYEAEGYAGQSLLIEPSRDLVMVITSDTWGPPERYQVQPPVELFTNYILPATGAQLVPSGLPLGPRKCNVFDLYRANVDGSSPRQLTEHLTLDLWGAPSPDGKRIAFQSHSEMNWELYVADANGEGVERLTRSFEPDSFPAWSPDGKTIVFSRESLYAINPKGGKPRKLTDGPDTTPSYSPDGETIVFTREGRDQSGGLWTADADGTNARELTGGEDGVEANYSYDGKRLTFYTSAGSKDSIFVMDADGSSRERIATGSHPHWLPDGTILFTDKKGKDDTMRIARWSDGEVTTAFDSPGDDVLPIPATDGTWFTFAIGSPTAPGGSRAAKPS